MLYANEQVINLENIREGKSKNKFWTSIIKKVFKGHKFITTVVIMFGVCSFMNGVLIYNFFEILKKV